MTDILHGYLHGYKGHEEQTTIKTPEDSEQKCVCVPARGECFNACCVCVRRCEKTSNTDPVVYCLLSIPISLHHGGDYSSWGPGKKYYNTI